MFSRLSYKTLSSLHICFCEASTRVTGTNPMVGLHVGLYAYGWIHGFLSSLNIAYTENVILDLLDTIYTRLVPKPTSQSFIYLIQRKYSGLVGQVL